MIEAYANDHPTQGLGAADDYAKYSYPIKLFMALEKYNKGEPVDVETVRRAYNAIQEARSHLDDRGIFANMSRYSDLDPFTGLYGRHSSKGYEQSERGLENLLRSMGRDPNPQQENVDAGAGDGKPAGDDSENAGQPQNLPKVSPYIQYDRNFTKEQYDQLYSDGSDYMRAVDWILENPSSDLSMDLLTRINRGEFGNMGNQIVDGNNFRRLATDYKKGAVHNALMELVAGESPMWADGKYGYTAAPWSAVQDAGQAAGAGSSAAETGTAQQEAAAAAQAGAAAAGGETADRDGDGVKDPIEEKEPKLLPTWMRYAPLASSILGTFNPQLYRRDYTNANILRDFANSLPQRKVRFRENLARMRYTPVDRNMLTNTQQANTSAAVRGYNGTNAGNAAAYNIAALKAGNEAVGSQYAQTALTNNQMYNQAMQFNNAVNQANAQGNLAAQQANAQLGQQRDQMRNSLMSQYVQYREAADNGRNRAVSSTFNTLAKNLGNLGRYNMNYNTIRTDPNRRYGTNPFTGAFEYWGNGARTAGAKSDTWASGQSGASGTGGTSATPGKPDGSPLGQFATFLQGYNPDAFKGYDFSTNTYLANPGEKNARGGRLRTYRRAM